MTDRKSYENRNRDYSAERYHRGYKDEGAKYIYGFIAFAILSFVYGTYFVSGQAVANKFSDGKSNRIESAKDKWKLVKKETVQAKYVATADVNQGPKVIELPEAVKENIIASRAASPMPNKDKKTSILPKLAFKKYIEDEKLQNKEISSDSVLRKIFWPDIKRVIGDKRRAFFQEIIKSPWNFCRTLSQEELISSFNLDLLPEFGKYFLILNFIDREYTQLLDRAIKSGFDVNYKNFLGESLLLTAVAWNKVESVIILMDNGGSWATESDWLDNPLHFAAMNNNSPLAHRALLCGIPINRVNKEGRTPINFATEFLHYEMFRFLANCGATTEGNIHQNFRNKYRAFSYSTTGLANFGSFRPKEPLWLNVRSIFDTKPDLELKEALKTETDEDKANAKKAYNHIQNGELVKIFEMYQNGVVLTKLMYNGRPLIGWAVAEDRFEILKFLLHEYEWRYCKDIYCGLSPLHLAVNSQGAKVEVVKLLLDYKFDPNDVDAFGNTPLHYAAGKAPIEVLQALLDAGAKCNNFNLKSETPLHYAFINKDSQAVGLLLKNGADINKKNVLGNTPLHYLSIFNPDTQSEIYEEAYRYKDSFDLSIKNALGETPQDMAGADRFAIYESQH